MTSSPNGTPVWYELMTPDPAAAQRFYGDVLGWQIGDSGMPGMDYRIARAGGDMVAGMMGLPPGLTMPFWLPYFGADGIDAAIGRITKGGGKVMHGPAEVPGGAWIVQATDPQGAFFALVGPK